MNIRGARSRGEKLSIATGQGLEGLEGFQRSLPARRRTANNSIIILMLSSFDCMCLCYGCSYAG